MSGFYSDPVTDLTLRKEARAGMTHTNNQTVFARTSESLFKAVLGSSRTRPGSKFFIEGEYTFSYGPQKNGSYIELTHITFNSTTRTETVTTNINPPAGDSARRRNVKPKIKGTSIAGPSSFPTTPQNDRQSIQTPQPAGPAPTYSQPQSDPATPYAGTSTHPTPATAETSAGGLPPPPAPAYQLDDFLDIDDVPSSQAPPQETVSPSELAKGKRRAQDSVDDEQSATRPKRNRKRTAKAAALRFFDTEAAEEADGGGIEVSENEYDGFL
jgi:hypothetical protein